MESGCDCLNVIQARAGGVIRKNTWLVEITTYHYWQFLGFHTHPFFIKDHHLYPLHRYHDVIYPLFFLSGFTYMLWSI